MADQPARRVVFRSLAFDVEVLNSWVASPPAPGDVVEVEVSHELWCRATLKILLMDSPGEAAVRALTDLYRLVSHHHASCPECLAYVVSELLEPEGPE